MSTTCQCVKPLLTTAPFGGDPYCDRCKGVFRSPPPASRSMTEKKSVEELFPFRPHPPTTPKPGDVDYPTTRLSKEQADRLADPALGAAIERLKSASTAGVQTYNGDIPLFFADMDLAVSTLIALRESGT